MTSRIRDIAITVVAVALLFFGGNFGLSCYKSKIIKDAKQAEAVSAGDRKIASGRDSLRIKDSTVVRDRIRYVDVARAAVAANPGDTTVANLTGACDQLIVSCADARKAAQTVIDDQAAQIDRLKKFSLPRFSVYALGGYDFLAPPKERASIQLCSELRVVGALSGVACGQASRREPTLTDSSTVKIGAVVSGKLTFR